jgi:hypothetical protein
MRSSNRSIGTAATRGLFPTAHGHAACRPAPQAARREAERLIAELEARSKERDALARERDAALQQLAQFNSVSDQVGAGGARFRGGADEDGGGGCDNCGGWGVWGTGEEMGQPNQTRCRDCDRGASDAGLALRGTGLQGWRAVFCCWGWQAGALNPVDRRGSLQ